MQHTAERKLLSLRTNLRQNQWVCLRETKLDACSILINAAKCPTESNRKPPPFKIRVSICHGFLWTFKMFKGILVFSILVVLFCCCYCCFFSVSAFASLRSRARRTLSVLYDQYFSPKVTVKLTKKGGEGGCGGRNTSWRLLKASHI